MAKSISKSVRLSDEVYQYIMQSPGKGFNEKFENIILRAKKEESDREKRLKDLQLQIDEEERKLYQLFEKYRYLDDYFRTFIAMRHQLDNMQQLLRKAAEADQDNVKQHITE